MNVINFMISFNQYLDWELIYVFNLLEYFIFIISEGKPSFSGNVENIDV